MESAEIIEKKLNQGQFTTTKIQPEKRKVVLDQVEGRDDLWINQLAKMKKQKQQEEEDWEDVDEEDGYQEGGLVLHPSIKMKQYDEYGFPVDGYDYKQHLALGN